MEGAGGCPPVRVAGGGLRGGDAVIDARRSSQYVSAVLMAAPYAARDVTLRFEGGELVSRPYVDLTLDVMRAFGARADWTMMALCPWPPDRYRAAICDRCRPQSAVILSGRSDAGVGPRDGLAPGTRQPES